MAFTATQIQFLQRLVSEKPAQRRAAEVSRFFCEHFSLGSAVGRFIEYREDHHKMAMALLKAHDLPVVALGPSATRAEVAVYGGLSEKSLSAAPHSRSIAVKFFGECRVDEQTLATPAGTYMVGTPEFLGQVECQRLMLVENLETFRRLEDYRWIDFQGLAVMAIFRGDPSLPVGEALELLRSRREAVWAFVDFDPAGLAIANALPSERLERIVLPSLQWLKQAADTLRGRQLFDDQVDRYAQTLDRSQHPELRAWWAEMRAWRSAVTQERMLHASAPGGLALHSGAMLTNPPREK